MAVVQAKKTPVHGQDHQEGQHSDEQPADKGHRPQGDGLEKAAVLHRRDDLLRQHHVPGSPQAGGVEDGGHQTLNDVKQGQHQLQAVGDHVLCQSEPDKQF